MQKIPGPSKSDPNDLQDDDRVSRAKPYSDKLKGNNYINQLFPEDNLEDDDEDDRDEDEPVPMDQDDDINLQKLFNEQNLRDNFATPQDRLIVATDRPERLQLRFQGRPKEQMEDLDREINWIAEKLILINREWQKEQETVLRKVKLVLESFLLRDLEIMYQWVYLRNEILEGAEQTRVEFTLEDMWYIYELDIEWNEIYMKRRQVQRFIQEIKNLTTIPPQILAFFNKSYNMHSLNAFEKWAEYQLAKLADNTLKIVQDGEEKVIHRQAAPKDANNRVYRRPTVRNFVKEMEGRGLQHLMAKLCLSPLELAENLESRSRKHVPLPASHSLEDLFKAYVNPDVAELSDLLVILKTLSKYAAGEYLSNPMIRVHLRYFFEKRVLIQTLPTENAKRMINIYSEYYPAKRIKNLKLADMKPELWMLIKEAEAKNLIKVTFNIMKEDVIKEIVSLSSEENPEREEFNLAWRYVVSEMYALYAPEFTTLIRKDLDEFGENKVVQDCARAFKEIIFVKPYRPNQYQKVFLEDAKFGAEARPAPENWLSGEPCNGYSDIRVITATSTENKTIFLLVDSSGEPMEQLILKNFPHQKKVDAVTQRLLYEADLNKLKDLISRGDPSVVVILPKSIRCHELKIELSSIIEQIKKTERIKPFVMWGLPNIPAAYASSSFSHREHPDLERVFLEALSMARYLQNPLAETLNLWSENDGNNFILKLKLHERQHLVNKAKLRRALENVAVEVVNQAGVDINQTITCPKMLSVLGFVAGLGPRKAKNLVEMVKSTSLGSIESRQEIAKVIGGRVIFTNAAGFLKIDSNANPKGIDAEL